MIRVLALIVALTGVGFAAGCHDDHDDHDHDRHANWDHNRREEVIVVPARGEDIRYHDREWHHDRD